MNRAVMGIVDTPAQAELAIERLRAAGFAPDDVSVLFPDRRGPHDFAFERHTKAPEGAIAGVGLGAAIGGILGLSMGIGVLAVPGLAALVAAGPLIAALSGMATIGSVGGLVGALLGASVPEIEAKHYAGKSRIGSILVAVHTDSSSTAKRAREALRSAAASDVTATAEAAVPINARA